MAVVIDLLDSDGEPEEGGGSAASEAFSLEIWGLPPSKRTLSASCSADVAALGGGAAKWWKGSGSEEELGTSASSSTRSRKVSSGLMPLVRLWNHPVSVRANGRERPVPDAELPSLAPATLLRKVLPPELADALLTQLLAESKEQWKPGDWVIYGKQQTTPRSSGVYWFEGASSDNQDARPRMAPSPELCAAADRLRIAVAAMRPSAKWRPSLALGNRYDGGSDCVGWHSDFLNVLGPRPVIVGLSLGATRHFKLRHVGAGEEGARGEGDATVVSIPMPHNTAVIMWDDCQEAWHHAVPRQADSSVGRHPKAGLVRLSLTFRMARPELGGENVKHCRCGRPCGLKSKGGRYYLACNPAGATAQCSFWEPCAWAQAEAERLRREAVPIPGAESEVIID
mmetsp:Transcript_70335/g.228624  ORF Transcript_70335/g.228624 Transcript_70335/m.228624 type:complete len:397 (-) Transcript_70335:38-1228(-)|eukprot:CAMPEP_0203867798 /NCGR_PEP_ID=MMETSP0359-20131031/16737_1 /ASSEMBLY_ACC=CAM_ASM_000338 /TAXON_ID=268821 /ORGANISM="Scrippsiella Hangoei, Strain SHTV-5" /LENGTH=396 /DNA_ID=CAMNT_0050786105 /DNA_START=39 /DNA_END=1229 /DNA_ORIENTATION=-